MQVDQLTYIGRKTVVVVVVAFAAPPVSQFQKTCQLLPKHMTLVFRHSKQMVIV